LHKKEAWELVLSISYEVSANTHIKNKQPTPRTTYKSSPRLWGGYRHAKAFFAAFTLLMLKILPISVRKDKAKTLL